MKGEGDSDIISGLDIIKSTLKLTGGYPAILESYQLGPGEPVELVYPKCADGTTKNEPSNVSSLLIENGDPRHQLYVEVDHCNL